MVEVVKQCSSFLPKTWGMPLQPEGGGLGGWGWGGGSFMWQPSMPYDIITVLLALHP